jgi:hypothetical protein
MLVPGGHFCSEMPGFACRWGNTGLKGVMRIWFVKNAGVRPTEVPDGCMLLANLTLISSWTQI